MDSENETVAYWLSLLFKGISSFGLIAVLWKVTDPDEMIKWIFVLYFLTVIAWSCMNAHATVLGDRLKQQARRERRARWEKAIHDG
jgi:threonine/homoserine/homoserine lactone efflux protein